MTVNDSSYPRCYTDLIQKYTRKLYRVPTMNIINYYDAKNLFLCWIFFFIENMFFMINKMLLSLEFFQIIIIIICTYTR